MVGVLRSLRNLDSLTPEVAARVVPEFGEDDFERLTGGDVEEEFPLVVGRAHVQCPGSVTVVLELGEFDVAGQAQDGGEFDDDEVVTDGDHVVVMGPHLLNEFSNLARRLVHVTRLGR